MRLKYFWFLPLFTFTACNLGQKVDDYTNRDLLVVTLEVENQPDLEKIVIVSNDGIHKDSLLKDDLTEQSTFKLRYPQAGDGTCTLCAYIHQDVVCDTLYVEKGYRPKLKLKNGKLNVLKWF